MLYSLNGDIPAPLPFRITLPDGRTRTDPATFTPEEVASAGYVEAPDAPVYDPATQYAPTWDGMTWTVRDKTAAELAAEAARAQAAALAALADARWAYEVGGITYTRASDGKVYGIATDRESQGKLDAERNAALAGLRTAGDVWKCLDVAAGAVVWVPFTDAEISEIAAAARAHVAAAFRREGELAALILAGDASVVWSPPD